MHDSDVMAAAVHPARTSPRLQTLHPALASPTSLTLTLPPSLPAQGMDRKQFTTPYPAGGHAPHLSYAPYHTHPHTHHHQPSLPDPGHPSQSQLSAVYDDDEVVEEDVDEDAMSDLEEELLQQYRRHYRQRTPDMTQQLLAFATMASADVHRFFGRRRGDEDSCDVYEDKWVVTKSGRELYYADLLRMAQGDSGESKSSAKASQKASSSSSTSSSRSADAEGALEDNRHSFSGKADSSLGLGPLKDLFDRALKAGKQRNTTAALHTTAKRARAETDAAASATETLPMRVRRLPESFWREPGSSGLQGLPVADTAASSDASAVGSITNSVGLDQPVSTSSVLQSLGASKLPDFSDLMESWHGDPSHHHHLQHPHPHLHPLHPLHLHSGSRTLDSDDIHVFAQAAADSQRKRRI